MREDDRLENGPKAGKVHGPRKISQLQGQRQDRIPSPSRRTKMTRAQGWIADFLLPLMSNAPNNIRMATSKSFSKSSQEHSQVSIALAKKGERREVSF